MTRPVDSPRAREAEVRVLVGVDDRSFVNLFGEFIRAAVPTARNVDVVSSRPRADDILEQCQGAPFDLVMLILNNIVFPDVDMSARKARRDRWIRFIAETKAASEGEVIVFCGVSEGDPVLDALHVTDAFEAGAGAFLRLPVLSKDVVGAIDRCLYG